MFGVKVLFPRDNLGCLGLKIDRWFYIDIFPLGGKPAGIFLRYKYTCRKFYFRKIVA